MSKAHKVHRARGPIGQAFYGLCGQRGVLRENPYEVTCISCTRIAIERMEADPHVTPNSVWMMHLQNRRVRGWKMPLFVTEARDEA